jgi:HK97 family phage major capsid protein
MTDNEELRRKTEQHNKIYQRMQEIQALPEKEGRDWTAEERTNWDAANTDINLVEADIERLQQSVKRARFAADLDKTDYSGQIGVRDAGTVETPEQSAETRAQLHDVEYNKAFSTYMRGGLERLSVEQRQLMLSNHVDNAETRAQQTTSGSVGGYLIPPGYRQVIVETMKAYGGLLNHANVITTSTGNPLQWPTNDETGNVGAILAEGVTVTESAMTFGTRTLGAYMYTSRQVFASMQILQDSVFNLEQFVPKALGVRLGRIVASHLVSGSGSGQPLGIATAPTVGSTGTGVAAISYDNLIDLEHSLDPAYRAGDCRFLLADQTLATIRKIKDSMGRPIWLPVPTTGFPSTINGLPYTIDQGMAVPGASAFSILFGDFQAGYIVRQVLDMQMVRFSERYMDALQIAFLAFMRLDARPDDPGAIRAFQHAAS